MKNSLLHQFSTVSVYQWRQVHTTVVSNQRAKYIDAAKKLEDEKRGVFRVLDIGKPRPFGQKKNFTERRYVVKAPPRYFVFYYSFILSMVIELMLLGKKS